MRRKLVKQGAATMMISLPSKWIKEHKLEKGSEVDVEPAGNNLIVSAKPLDIKSETTIELINAIESSIRTLITNAYRAGYDKIKVFFKNEKQFEMLKQIIKTRLIGFEIIHKEKNSCTVENITEPSADQFENILRKLFYEISEFLNITKKRFENAKENYDYEELAERIQKYDNFCRRIISKRKLTNIKSELLWTFLVLIIHGQREIYHLNKLLDKKINLSDKTKKLFGEVTELFELIKKAYLEKNISSLANVHELEKEIIYQKAFSLLQEKSGKENLVIYHLIVATREFYQSNSPLSGLILV